MALRKAFFFDPNDPKWREKLATLAPISGYCVFIDIAGSTALKDGPIERWASFISNTFGNARAFLEPTLPPLKCLGDSLMFFIPESILNKTATPLSLFASLKSICSDPDPLFCEVKVGATYCTDAYELTFIKGTYDVYGKGIDLAARLLSRAESRELLMNEPFAQQIRQEFETIDNKQAFSDVRRVVGPWPEQIRGFSRAVNIYKLPRSAQNSL